MKSLPTGPYLMRALYEWCADSGLTPYLSVRVDARTRVPQGFVKDGEIVLNLAPGAVRDLHMDNDWVSFSARFGGVAHEVRVPVDNVLAIYARETGEGMAFPQHVEATDAGTPGAGASQPDSAPQAAAADASEEGPPPGPPKGRPQLRVVK